MEEIRDIQHQKWYVGRERGNQIIIWRKLPLLLNRNENLRMRELKYPVISDTLKKIKGHLEYPLNFLRGELLWTQGS